MTVHHLKMNTELIPKRRVAYNKYKPNAENGQRIL
jgi:hypothetical protein